MQSRRQFMRTSLALGTLAALSGPRALVAGTEFQFDPARPLIPAPRDPAAWPEFRQRLAAWRAAARGELNYSDTFYTRPEFAWTRRCFSCGFLMLCDELILDGKRGDYRSQEFLEHSAREFGGHDAVVLWQAYPRIGFDERNQFDFYRDLPGGLPGLRRLSEQLHANGVRVFVAYNPWDCGTRREPLPDADVLVDIIQAIAADGVFLDTLDRGAVEFRAKLDAGRAGVALESEGALPVSRIADHHLSWAQWFDDSEAPGVLRNKWFERRHLQHQIRRWDRDHTGELHTAWMNGSGVMVWENVFGTWVGWNARDRALLRAMRPIQRQFAEVFTGENWVPLVPTEHLEIFASEWGTGDLRLWTLVNRSELEVAGDFLRVNAGSVQCFDLVRGLELKPTSARGQIILHGVIPARGIGCIAAVDSRSSRLAEVRGLALSQRKLHRRAGGDVRFPARLMKQPQVKRTKRLAQPPAGMVEIPTGKVMLTSKFRVRECGFYESDDAKGFAGADLHTSREFVREVTLKRYAMDETPVTNDEFRQFLQASSYRPPHVENFLRHWINGSPPPGQADHPVVYVDLDDARAYARWARKRLPTEEEWQFAAEGRERRVYPWGNERRAGVCNTGQSGGTTAVRQFPDGRSPFGCYDLCGNIWHWTESERRDGRTRFCILKGGGWFQSPGSVWYADGGPQPGGFAAKFLLSWSGLDRCSTIGFRCVVDLTAR